MSLPSVLGEGALLKEATTRITQESGRKRRGKSSYDWHFSSPLPSTERGRENGGGGGSCFDIGGGGEEVFQDCVILIDFVGEEREREETNRSSESAAKL